MKLDLADGCQTQPVVTLLLESLDSRMFYFRFNYLLILLKSLSAVELNAGSFRAADEFCCLSCVKLS